MCLILLQKESTDQKQLPRTIFQLLLPLVKIILAVVPKNSTGQKPVNLFNIFGQSCFGQSSRELKNEDLPKQDWSKKILLKMTD
jgi:hypothetical protein